VSVAFSKELPDEILKNCRGPDDFHGLSGIMKRLANAPVERAMRNESTGHLFEHEREVFTPIFHMDVLIPCHDLRESFCRIHISAKPFSYFLTALRRKLNCAFIRQTADFLL
jgi:hypothetical protein